MANELLKRLCYLITTGILLLGCGKNNTKYRGDAEDPGLAIFSNTGNNILSCLIEGKPWRTISQTTSGFNAVTRYEVYIEKKMTNGINDTLIITWPGYFQGDEYNVGQLSLHVAVPSNFNVRSLSALQGQRLRIDSTNGFFSANINELNIGNTKGSGNFYIHTSRFDSLALNTYHGEMSGLFDAIFNSFKIERGRFDHSISPEQIRF